MENKINIAELLKDCPKGMELDCTMFDNVTFVRVDNNREQFPIEIAVGGLRSKYLTKEGSFHDTTLLPEAKCVIFPKGKTTWEGFVPPVEFEDGDILVHGDTVFIYNGVEDDLSYGVYVIIDSIGLFAVNTFTKKYVSRFATEKEKQKLFDAIRVNGYKWNTETKTLEKLITPRFKVGDRIVKKNSVCVPILITKVSDEFYYSNTENSVGVLPISEQDNYELVPDKFDISKLEPFDKVLVRDTKEQVWVADLFSHIVNRPFGGYTFSCVGHYPSQCIPYEGNEHLLGTTNDCDNFYKIN